MWVRESFRHYEIRAEIGRGGMSRVFRAYDPTLDRHVALKILLERFNHDDERVQQFEKEAQITASFAHPHVVRVYAVERELNDLVIVMELVEKGSLEEHVSQHGKLPEKQAANWILDTAQGLQAAFQNGLIHRDVKPGNILLDNDRSAKLVDFGLALMFQSEKDDSEDIWATPYYVALEKLLGEGEDHRSDIYSLGATLFHLLAGKPSFDVVSGSYEELRKAKLKPVSTKALAPHVSPAVCRLVERMMAPKPQDRPDSYDALIKLIENAHPAKRRSSTVHAKAVGSTNIGSAGQRFLASQRIRRGAEKRRRVAVGICLAISVTAILVATWKKRQSEFSHIPTNSLPTEATDGQVTTTGGDARQAELSATYQEGRRWLQEGDAGKALEAFSQVLADDSAISEQKHWARFHLGLSQLLSHQEPAARQTFSTLFLNTKREAEDSASALLHQAASQLKEDQAVSIASASIPSSQSDHAVALLAYGLKNWERNAFTESKAHLSLYSEQAPTDDAYWTGDYQDLVADHLADLEWLTQRPNIDQLNDPSKLTQARRSLRQHIKDARTSKARGVAEELLLAVARKLDAPDAPAPTQEATDAPTADLILTLQESESRLWQETASRRAPLLKTLDFKKGLTDLEALADEFESPAGSWFLRDQVHAWSMASAFIDHLASAVAGRQGSIVRTDDRQSLEGEIVAATPETLSLKTATGTVSVPMAQIEPASLAGLALNVIEDTRDSNLYYRRQEELVFFAFLIGLDAVLERQAPLLRQENRPFRLKWDRLQTFKKSLSSPPTKPAQHG